MPVLGKHPPSNGAAGRAGGLNMAFDPHKAKNAGAEGLLVGDLLFQKVLNFESFALLVGKGSVTVLLSGSEVRAAS